jgi:hypothetical protein
LMISPDLDRVDKGIAFAVKVNTFRIGSSDRDQHQAQ